LPLGFHFFLGRFGEGDATALDRAVTANRGSSPRRRRPSWPSASGSTGQWARYNGTSAYGKMITADAALEECRKGKTQAGIADLKQVLQRSSIPLPPSETATAPR